MIMPEGELWSTLVTAINPRDTKAMPAVLQSTINLLETELANAKAALHAIQPNASPLLMSEDGLTVGAMAAYRRNLIGRASDFYYGASRLSPKDVGLVSVQEVSDSDNEVEEPQECAVSVISPKKVSLDDILGNSLILDHLAPYLSVPSLFALASTSRYLRSVVIETPYVFRHLDLTRCQGAQISNAPPTDPGGQEWRTAHMSESLGEDDFYPGPLKGIFSNLEKKSILQDVRTLVLDGLSVPAELVADLVLTDHFNVNILSIRDCHNLNERKLMQVLQHAVRPSRPKGTPRVKAIYHFTPMDHPKPMARSKYRDWWGSRCGGQADVSTLNANSEAVQSQMYQESKSYPQNAWYAASGKLLKIRIEEGWAETIKKCEGIIAFDAVLCRGPRHTVDSYTPTTQIQGGPPLEGRMPRPAIATIALGPKGCDGCHSSPEGLAIWGQSPDENFPLLTPVPLHSSSVAAAKRPSLFPDGHPILMARCQDCLSDRWCHRCNKWFCVGCLPHPEHVRNNLSPHQTAFRARRNNQENASSPQERRELSLGVSKDCWECGPTCATCKLDCQRTCQNCQGEYCIEHNEGCSSTMCDWCNTSTRHRMRELY